MCYMYMTQGSLHTKYRNFTTEFIPIFAIGAQHSILLFLKSRK